MTGYQDSGLPGQVLPVTAHPPKARRVVAPKRLSRPLTDIRARYDVVVIGSGYGGAIAASRLARAGRKVCMLERGREILTGDFPNTAAEGISNIQVTSSGGRRIGSKTALYDMRMDTETEQHVLVGCGLGGTSLINANVAVEADRRILADPSWPKELREKPETLLPYYARAREVLNASPYPDDFRRLRKVEALKKSVPRMAKAKGCATKFPGDSSGDMSSVEHVEFLYPPLAVTWRPPGGRDPDSVFVNDFGVEQRASTFSGDCCSGCNDGSKNTTQMNYIPDAVLFGTEVFCEVEVRYLEKTDQGLWKVTYVPQRDEYDDGKKFDESEMPFVLAEIVVLGAGSMGSTEILMRSKHQRGLQVSGALGATWSGNGGLLGFCHNSEVRANSIGLGEESALCFEEVGFDPTKPATEEDEYDPPGPCIVGMVKYHNPKAVEEEFAVEDGTPPGIAVKTLRAGLSAAAAVGGKEFGEKGLSGGMKDLQRALEGVIYGPNSSGSLMQHTHSLLGVCHDETAGKLLFKGDKAVVHWPDAGNTNAIKRLYGAMEHVAKEVRGEFVPNPIYMPAFDVLGTPGKGKNLVSVHPMGGCQMGDGPKKAVTNHLCEVFTGKEDGEVYPDLLVVDAGVIPRSLAVNPFLTICALAERAMELLVQRKVAANTPGWKTLQFDPHSSVAELQAAPLKDSQDDPQSTIGISFTEAMVGYMSKNPEQELPKNPEPELPKNPQPGCEPGGRRKSSLEYTDEDLKKFRDAKELAKRKLGKDNKNFRFILTVVLNDLDKAIADPNYEGVMTGTVRAPDLSPEPLQVTRGIFTCFGEDQGSKCGVCKQMKYTMWLTSQAGEVYFFEGFKLVRDEGTNLGISLVEGWKDTSTLYISIWDGKKTKILHRGMLRIKPTDFLIQAQTMQVLNATSTFQKAKAFYKFGKWFAGNCFDTYGPCLFTLGSLSYWCPDAPPRRKRQLRAPAPKPYPLLKSADCSTIKLTRYKGGTKGPVLLVHPFATHSGCWSIDTIQTSMVEYLTSCGYDTFLLDWRVSIALYEGDMAKCEGAQDMTMDAATQDMRAAVDQILKKRSDVSCVDVVSMCAGSIALACALLSKDDDKFVKKVRSVCALTAFTHFDATPLADVKAGCMSCMSRAAPQVLEAVSEIDVRACKKSSWLYKTMDKVIAFSQMEDNVRSAMHYRIKTLYGEMYESDNITRKTMNTLYEIFGTGSTVSMGHFAEMTRAGHLVDAKGQNVYLPQMNRLVDMPITLISGARDGIWLPGSTEVGARELRAAGAKRVARHVVHGYGHMDLVIGRDAAKDVWPIILQHLEAAAGNGQHVPVQRAERFKGVSKIDGSMVSLDLCADIVTKENQRVLEVLNDPSIRWGGSGFAAGDFIPPKADDLELANIKVPAAKEEPAKGDEKVPAAKEEPAKGEQKAAADEAEVDALVRTEVDALVRAELEHGDTMASAEADALVQDELQNLQ